MKMESAGGGVVRLPTAEEPLPEFLGTHGLQLLRQLIRDLWRDSDRAKVTEAQRAAVAEMVTALDRLMVPAKPAEIGRVLEALMHHYPAVTRTPEAAESVAADWLRDMGHLPPDIVDAACTAWRRGQNAFAPTPGHLLALAEPIFVARRHMRDMARRLVAPVGSVKAAAGGR